jgi:fatty-acyl-CoA synthase
MLEAARDADFDSSEFDLAIFGGESMPQSLLSECREMFTENFVTPYGMTEFGPAVTFPTATDIVERPGTVGRPGPNHNVRVVEPTENEEPDDPVTPSDTVPTETVGEIILQGPCMMDGYWNAPEQTAAAIREGWYFTGDAGYRDEDGYLFLVDRVDDMIISGGENIYPATVEDVLYDHEHVSEVAVVGTNHDVWGQAVTAFIIPDGEVSASDLEHYCRESNQLADFKRPRRYVFQPELPTNQSGKIQRYKLRDLAAEGEFEYRSPGTTE